MIEQIGNTFWLARIRRQGCPLNTLLLSMYVNFRFGRGHKEKSLGRIKARKKNLITGSEKYFVMKKLKPNRDKTKVTRFRKGGGRKKKYAERWKGIKIDQVKE